MVAQVLQNYGLEEAHVERIEEGLINDTFKVEASKSDFPQRYVLQRLNPIFSPKIHEDIEAVTLHLKSKGVATPSLVRTTAGALWVEREDPFAGVWRLLTFVEGQTFSKLTSPSMAQAAGRLLGRFHCAVGDLNRAFENARLGVHDTEAHLHKLRQALQSHRTHPRYAMVGPLAQEILEIATSRPEIPKTEDRVVHGDPKVSNLIFSSESDALCLVDLDTLARMPLALELGDAFRSWCNPEGEDAQIVRFDLELFQAAIQGYAAGAQGALSDLEVKGIVPGTETIIIELAARFCADALLETYFGWNPKRFKTRGEHNERRARAQLELARSLIAQREGAQTIVAQAFSGG